VASVTSLLAIYGIYRFFALKKKFNKLAIVSEKLIETNKQIIKEFSTQKGKFSENQTKTKNLIIKLKSASASIVEHRKNVPEGEINQNAGHVELITMIAKNQKNNAKNHLKITTDKLSQINLKNTTAAQNYSKTLLTNVHENFVIKRDFNSYKTDAAFIVLSALSLVVFSRLVQIGLSDMYHDAFVNTLSTEAFPASSFDVCLNVQDFNSSEKNFTFYTYSTDSQIQNFHEISAAELNKFII
jgi:hypothetical protein